MHTAEKDEEGEISGSILSDHDAYKYKVFDVIYGKKKNYLLGVDEEHIQIFKKKGGQKDAAGKQRVLLLIKLFLFVIFIS